MKYKENNLRM